MSIILGIDPGIADTGYGVIKKNSAGNLSCLAYGTIRTPAGRDLPERLLLLSSELEKIIKQYKPALSGVEELYFCNNVKTALVVGQARGVALLALKKNGLSVKSFTPLQIKQAVSAYGRASKMQVQKMVKLLLDMEDIPRPDDAADALAAAICAANS